MVVEEDEDVFPATRSYKNLMPSSCRFLVGMLLIEQKCACGKLRSLGAALQPARLSRQKLNPGQGRRAHSQTTVSASSHPPPTPVTDL